MTMASVLITREHRSWMDRARSYQILVNGSSVGEIKNDEAKEFQLEEGEHVIQAKIDWCSSPELKIRVSEEQVKLRCGPTATPFTALLYVLWNRGNYLWLRMDEV